MLGYVSNANDMRTLHALQVFSSSSSSCLVRCFRNNRTEFISFSQITELQKRKTVASDRVHKYLPFLVNCARARSLAVRSSNYKMKSCLIWFICLFIEFVPYRSERWSTNNRQEIKIKKSEFDKTFLLQWNQRHSRCLNERGLTHIHNSTIIFMKHFGVWITITQLRIESNWKEWKARENKRIQRLRERKRERESWTRDMCQMNVDCIKYDDVAIIYCHVNQVFLFLIWWTEEDENEENKKSPLLNACSPGIVEMCCHIWTFQDSFFHIFRCFQCYFNKCL